MAKITLKNKPLTIAVSACLLGEWVRYDGGHRSCCFVTETLANLFDLVAVCPEVAVGMGVPRPMIHLVDQGGDVRVVRLDDPRHDETERLQQYGNRMVAELAGVCAYVFKSRSPSCGLSSPLSPSGVAPGVFAQVMRQAWPEMPMVEEGQLLDEQAQRRFIAQAVAYGQHRMGEMKV